MNWRNFMRAAIASKEIILRRRAPLYLSINLTSRCNLKCPHCGIWQDDQYTLPTKEIIRIVNEAADAGCIAIALLGGEPLLHPGLGKIIRAADKRGIMIRLTTNGMILSDSINRLKGLHTLKVSLDGPEFIHDSLRGQGSYKCVVKGVKLAAEKLSCKIIFNTVLWKDLVKKKEYIDEVVYTAMKYADGITFQPVEQRHELAKKGVYSIVPHKKDLQNAVWHIMHLKRKHPSFILNSMEFLRSLASEQMRNPEPCAAGTLFARISSDGTLRSCDRIEVESYNLLDFHKFVDCWNAMSNVGNCNQCNRNNTVEFNRLISMKKEAFRSVKRIF